MRPIYETKVMRLFHTCAQNICQFWGGRANEKTIITKKNRKHLLEESKTEGQNINTRIAKKKMGKITGKKEPNRNETKNAKIENTKRKRKWKFSGKSSREGQIQREPDK